MSAKVTKGQFLAAMKALGVEIADEPGLGRHIHAYAPNGKRFVGHGIHNLSLWDSYTDSPDWAAIAKEIGYPGAVLEDCDDPDCDVCDVTVLPRHIMAEV